MHYVCRICGVLLLTTASVCVAQTVNIATSDVSTQTTPSVITVQPELISTVPQIATRGIFDSERWNYVIENIGAQARAKGVSESMLKSALRYPAYIPSIVKSDKHQAEFKLTMEKYLSRTVNSERVKNGRKMRAKYPTLLSRVDKKFGVPPHVILAFWGLESNYGQNKAQHKLTDAFLTLVYEGRRETFFTNQLIALMKFADKNKLDVDDIHGSWAGAMGHFQFIPTTLTQYGIDGNGDKRVNIIDSIGDAMFSAGNYLNKLGWDKNQRIVRRVILPADFDISLLDGKTKLSLPQWSGMGVLNPDGSPIPETEMVAGLVADVSAIDLARSMASSTAAASDTDVAPMPVITAYLTYPNFYRIKKWNNSNWYAIAISELADKLH